MISGSGFESLIEEDKSFVDSNLKSRKEVSLSTAYMRGFTMVDRKKKGIKHLILKGQPNLDKRKTFKVLSRAEIKESGELIKQITGYLDASIGSEIH